MDFDTGRRRFLELAGTGTAFSLAGCSALDGDAASQTTTDPGTEAPGEDRRVTVAVRADQEKLQERQQEIASELRSGNITRSEAQQQFRTAQQDLLANAASSFTEHVESTATLTVVDAAESVGAFLVEAPASTLIDTLSVDAVSSLLPEATFEVAKEQARQRGTGTATGTSTTSN